MFFEIKIFLRESALHSKIEEERIQNNLNKLEFLLFKWKTTNSSENVPSNIIRFFKKININSN